VGALLVEPVGASVEKRVAQAWSRWAPAWREAGGRSLVEPVGASVAKLVAQA